MRDRSQLRAGALKTACQEPSFLRVHISKKPVREKAKAAGGRWHREKQLWSLPFEKTVELGYERRIVSRGGDGQEEIV